MNTYLTCRIRRGTPNFVPLLQRVHRLIYYLIAINKNLVIIVNKAEMRDRIDRLQLTIYANRVDTRVGQVY